MDTYTVQLNELRQKMARKSRLESELNELMKQQSELKQKLDELEKVKVKEEQDLEKIEEGSLMAFFYALLGKKEEKLSKEEEEAYLAGVKYEVALRELEDVEYSIRRKIAELKDLQAINEQYQVCLDRKREELKQSNPNNAEAILKLESEIAYLKNQLIEIEEAAMVGREASAKVHSILESLDSAQSWGALDLMGGGMLTTLVKHEKLGTAQKQIQELQLVLRSLKTELADVEIDTEMQVQIDGFLNFADYFFDGFFSDLVVLSEINNSQAKVRETKEQIEILLNRLARLGKMSAEACAKAESSLESLVIELEL